MMQPDLLDWDFLLDFNLDFEFEFAFDKFFWFEFLVMIEIDPFEWRNFDQNVLSFVEGLDL